MSRKTSKVQTTGAKTFTVGYTWGDSGSALDKLTAITYPSGTGSITATTAMAMFPESP
jgi:hypothetical protein